jgi:hypothetical protein
MGSYAASPDWDDAEDADEDSTARLGDVLSGRLAAVDIDSVEASRTEDR